MRTETYSQAGAARWLWIIDERQPVGMDREGQWPESKCWWRVKWKHCPCQGVGLLLDIYNRGQCARNPNYVAGGACSCKLKSYHLVPPDTCECVECSDRQSTLKGFAFRRLPQPWHRSLQERNPFIRFPIDMMVIAYDRRHTDRPSSLSAEQPWRCGECSVNGER